MILLIKMITAHIIGDFVLQSQKWVEEKKKKKVMAPALYFHVFIHGLLLFVFTFDAANWLLILLIMLTHYGIDLAKLYFQQPRTKTMWFFADQLLHLISLFIIWFFLTNQDITLFDFLDSADFWAYSAGLFFLIFAANILIRELLSYIGSLAETNNQSLPNAGKYIGIIERLLIFIFVVLDFWQAIGFLLAAKSIFRFGDLSEAKNRKLTEYVMIGTLLSFGIAIVCGLIVSYIVR